MTLEGNTEETWDALRTGHGDTGRARALASHSRVRAIVTLPDVWGLQFLNQDADDANKEDEVHLVVVGQGWVVRERRLSSSLGGWPVSSLGPCCPPPSYLSSSSPPFWASHLGTLLPIPKAWASQSFSTLEEERIPKAVGRGATLR